LATLSFGNLSTCPSQLNLLFLMCLTIFSYLIVFSSSSFVLSNLKCHKIYNSNLYSEVST
jgi:hypothetical protein